ncbi:unnamed protein product, partial [Prorocentrum cordatum]
PFWLKHKLRDDSSRRASRLARSRSRRPRRVNDGEPTRPSCHRAAGRRTAHPGGRWGGGHDYDSHGLPIGDVDEDKGGEHAAVIGEEIAKPISWVQDQGSDWLLEKMLPMVAEGCRYVMMMYFIRVVWPLFDLLALSAAVRKAYQVSASRARTLASAESPPVRLRLGKATIAATAHPGGRRGGHDNDSHGLPIGAVDEDKGGEHAAVIGEEIVKPISWVQDHGSDWLLEKMLPMVAEGCRYVMMMYFIRVVWPLFDLLVLSAAVRKAYQVSAARARTLASAESSPVRLRLGKATTAAKVAAAGAQHPAEGRTEVGTSSGASNGRRPDAGAASPMSPVRWGQTLLLLGDLRRAGGNATEFAASAARRIAQLPKVPD